MKEPEFEYADKQIKSVVLIALDDQGFQQGWKRVTWKVEEFAT